MIGLIRCDSFGEERQGKEYDLMVMGFLCGHWRTSLDWRKKAAEDQRGEGMEERAVYLYRSSSRRAGARVSGMCITVSYVLCTSILFIISSIFFVLFSLCYFIFQSATIHSLRYFKYLITAIPIILSCVTAYRCVTYQPATQDRITVGGAPNFLTGLRYFIDRPRAASVTLPDWVSR